MSRVDPTTHYHEGTQRFYARVELPPSPDGKRRRKTIYNIDEKKLARELRKLLHERDKGVLQSGDNMTVKAFLEKWLEEVVKPARRQTTYEAYESNVRLHIVPAIGPTQLGKLTAAQVHSMLAALARPGPNGEPGLAPGSVRLVLLILRIALNQALRWDMVQRNVATLVSAPAVKRPEMAHWTADEARGFLAAVKDDRLAALYLLALALGMRQGEILALRWEDVDLDAGSLEVKASLRYVDRKPVFSAPKTTSSRRTLSLPTTLVTALHQHRARQLREQALAGAKWVASGLVFTRLNGKPIHPRALYESFITAVAQSGLTPIRFHDLRHLCATMLLERGEPLTSIRDLLGHSSIAMTANLYAHVTPQLRRNTAAAMERILSPIGSVDG